MIRVAFVLSLLAAAAPSAGEGARPPVRYVTTVSFGDGACRYWTGDAMVDATGFSRDLRRRFDRRTGMIIVHSADLPAQCTSEARKLAARAGFRDVRLEVARVDQSLP